MTYFRDRQNAILNAFSGLVNAFEKEVHMRLHGVFALVALATSFYFSITPIEWILILACISLVFIAEIINSAIEKTCDMITTEIHPTIKYIKDISAGAVLVACFLSVLTGLFIFWPYLKNTFGLA